MSQKPAIILVHGAWHGPLHYMLLVDALSQAGHQVIAPQLKSAGPAEAATRKTIEDDARVIRDTFLPIIDAGNEAIILSHSYGGIPATDSVIGFTTGERKVAGRKGGVRAVVYLAAFAPPQACLSLLDMVGAKSASDIPPWWSMTDDLALLNREAFKALFGDVDESLATLAWRSLLDQSLESFQGPCKHASSEINTRKIYVTCKDDHAIPHEGQLAMAKAAQAAIHTLNCGHSAFLRRDMVVEIVNIIRNVSVSD